MVIILHRCSYDNSTISSVNKLNQYDASLLFSLLSLFFLSLFFLISFSNLCQIRQRVVLLNLLDTKVNPNCVLFHRGQGPGRVAQSVGHLTHKSGVLGSIPGLATYFRFSFRFFKKGSCQLLAKVCARSTG